MRILLVEDEPVAAQMLAKGLTENAYAVDIAGDGEEALKLAFVNSYDLIILDVMLPVKDGLAVCRELRESGSNVAIIMLTARDAISNRIEGLDHGADDYLVKPFNFFELLARMRALLRRGPVLRDTLIEIADLSIDTRAQKVWRAGTKIDLTTKEYMLLEYLARCSNAVVSRGDIAEHVWDDNFDPFSNLIEVYIKRLRRKIDDGHSLKLLHTRRGAGYQLGSEV